MTSPVNRVLLGMAAQSVWGEASGEKQAFQPAPGAAPDPMAGGAPAAGGMPPAADPSMGPAAPPGAGGGAPPMDPAMMGGAPPPADPSMMGGMPDPGMAMQMGMGPGGQKIKPEQWMQALDFRLYNMQQQITALLNNLSVQIPSGALITPPGMPAAPQVESAMPGGPQDPSQQPEGGGGGNSAIGSIDPIQGASPEMAQMGGGGGGGGMEQGKMASTLPPVASEFLQEAEANCPAGFRVVLLKAATTGEGYPGSVDEEKPPTVSSPPKPLRGPHPGKTPSLTGPPTAGGSKDPKSRTEASDEMGPANGEKSSAEQFAAGLAEPVRSASYIGDPVERTPDTVADTVAAVAARYRSRAGQV